MTALLTADWDPMGKNDYFRKFEIYSMEWYQEVSIDTIALTSTQFGGPIAVIRDKTKVVKVQTGKPTVSIFTTSGRLISSFLWNSGQIIKMGWSSTLDLLCVQDDGSVLIYDMFGKYKHLFGMGQEAQDTRVISAQIFRTGLGTGVAVLTTEFRIFLVNSVKEPKVRKLPEIPDHTHVLEQIAWLAICEDRHSRVLFARGKDLYSLNETETSAISLHVDLGDEPYSIKSMAVTCNNDYLAILSNRGKLWIGTTDLRTCLCIYDTRNCKEPQELVWCGVDAVIINWGTAIELIAPAEKSIYYSYDTNVFLVQEIDCARIISLQTQELIQKVPEVVKDIFKINSTSPSCYLLEASKQFQKKSHRANEYLHLVKPKLGIAITKCIEAASHEYFSETQQMLMKAAQFGKTFMDDCDPESVERYVAMCKFLRCLNAIRNPKIGIPLTFEQFWKLSVQGLLELLINQRQYYIALEIANFLKMKGANKILSDWACYKVKQSDIGTEQVAREIAEKLGRAKGVSYTAIALKASECGRRELAIKLIDYEPKASNQVPLLLELGQDKAALMKAIDSGNTDLVHSVLIHLRDRMPMAKFQMEIRNIPLAQALYIKYCQQHNRETLKDIYTQEDDHNSLAECFIRESFNPKTSGMREASLVAAQDNFKLAKNDVHASFCEEQLKIFKYQRNLEEKFKKDFVGKSLHETVKLLLQANEVKLADKLRSEFKVPDRRYWWLRLQVLGERGEWTEVEKLSKMKKSPIGYEPFVDICLQYEKSHEAQKYLSKVKEELKVKYLVKLEMFGEAAQTAFNQRDQEALAFVKSKCDPILAEKIDMWLLQITKKMKLLKKLSFLYLLFCINLLFNK